MEIKQDDFEKREKIDPIPGQMCYDELLLPNYEEEKEKPDTSVAAGQMDLWSLPKQEEKEKQAFGSEIKTNDKTEIQTFEKKIEIEGNFAENSRIKIDEISQEKTQEKFELKAEKESEFFEEKTENETCELPNFVVAEDEKLERERVFKQEDNLQEIEEEKSEIVTEKNDDFEKENFAFQAPKKLRKISTSHNFNNEDGCRSFDYAQDDNLIDDKTGDGQDFERNSLAQEGQEEAEEEQNFEDETTHVDDDEMEIDFENPPKKHEKEEIIASKSHFFGNYENPFED